MQQTLLKAMDDSRKELKSDIAGVQRQLDIVKEGVRNIDKRLDDIELQFLPGRVRRLEMKTFGRTFSR